MLDLGRRQGLLYLCFILIGRGHYRCLGMASNDTDTLFAHDGEAALHQVDLISDLAISSLFDDDICERLILAADLTRHDSLSPYRCSLTSSTYHLLFALVC